MNSGRNDPLHWTCPKCGANPNEKCRVVVPGGKLKLDHDFGTHSQRRRLALFFQFNPTAPFDEAAWGFSTKARDKT